MSIKEFYLSTFPKDEMGLEIKESPTFAGLLNLLINKGDVYEYIGVKDSLIRERIFQKLSEQLNVEYDYVYELWNPGIKKQKS